MSEFPNLNRVPGKYTGHRLLPNYKDNDSADVSLDGSQSAAGDYVVDLGPYENKSRLVQVYGLSSDNVTVKVALGAAYDDHDAYDVLGGQQTADFIVEISGPYRWLILTKAGTSDTPTAVVVG